MKRKFFALFSLAFVTAFGVLTYKMVSHNEDIEGDNVVYDENVHAKLDSPHLVSAEEEGEGGDDTIPEVDKVILHYHNDDGRCGKDTTSRGSNGGRAFYVWATGVKGVEFYPDKVSNNGEDMELTVDFGNEKFSKFGGKASILFIIKFRSVDDRDENWGGQSSDTVLSFLDFPPNEDKVVEVWTMHGQGSDIVIYDNEAQTKVLGIKTAYFKDWKNIHCINTATSGVEWTLFAYDETYFKYDAKIRSTYKRWYAVKTGNNSELEFDIALPRTAHINIVYCLESLDKSSTNGLMKTAFVTYDKLYDDARFNKYYTYTKRDLGMQYTPTATTFKVWAPTAGNMTLLLYEVGETVEYGGSNKYKGYHMNYTGYGAWELTVEGDLAGKYYNYLVDNTSGTFEAVDPYATAVGYNGLRGYVYDKKQTNPEGWDELPLIWDKEPGLDIKTPQELTIYEVHVQDFTGDSSWNGSEKPGTYNAFVEKGTRLADNPTVKTGYDHLDELGVKAVQILPFFDHDNEEGPDGDYNWGYNPLNYNAVEGAYSSDPHNPLARITELKNLVLRLSETKARTRLIMDVVYNHVSRASGSSFTKLMPGYYFRYNEDGTYADGSGCSNEVRSEALMMRKFIIDSVMMWAREYKIKGFRFDLMGLIDIETLKQLKIEMYEFDPDVYLYGEGWSLGYNGKGVPGGNTAEVGKNLHDANTPGIVGGFNDAGRNALRGGNDQGWGSKTAHPGWGFLQKGSEYTGTDLQHGVAEMLWGINSNGIGNPKQTVNYASCHDNWTVMDQLYYTLGDSGQGIAPSYETVIKTSITGHSLVMASNSAAFMLGGEEIYRTKELTTKEQRDSVAVTTYENFYGRYFSHNSYNSPLEVNSFKWGNKVKAHGVNVSSYFDTWKKMIQLHHEMQKYEYKEPFPYTTTTAGNPIDGINWSGSGKNGTHTGVAGFQLDEYFIFASGRNWGYVNSDARSWTYKYSFGTWKHGDYGNAVDLGNIDSDTGAAVVVFYRGK